MDFKKYKDTVYQIIGAAMEVHSELNWGLLEPAVLTTSARSSCPATTSTTSWRSSTRWILW